MTYLSTEDLSKSYADKLLFEGLSFGLSEGDKTALIAENGIGKSTLLKILAGKEEPDSGKVMVQKNIDIGFLVQDPKMDNKLTIREYIGQDDNETVQIIRNYHEALQRQAEEFNQQTSQAFERATAAMDAADAWDYEQRMEQILAKLNIHNLDQSISTLSGGERKRVAMAFVLLDEPDLLILDEPTNHLDIEMIEWLEKYLIQTKMTLLMVTHDRYFLDRVCDHILELDQGKLYHHEGNYEYFLQKRAERREVERKAAYKANQLFKKELEWMRRSPKARTTKSKSRIDRFHEVKKKADPGQDNAELKLTIDMPRLGGKILEMKNVSKSFEDKNIIDDFYYTFEKGERIGIIGDNGAGKSTFLDMLTGKITDYSGKIRVGKTISFGHYEQDGLDFNEDERVIDIIEKEAKIIKLENGKKITASKFLEHFMFTSEMQYTHVRKLSGGEKRRLALMKVLLENPNFLILDEPTNDLDLLTLNKLEEFLLDFKGNLIIVSHDRYFMDKLVDHYFVFEGEGQIQDFNGTYEEYRTQKLAKDAEHTKTNRINSDSSVSQSASSSPSEDKKLNYNERREYNKLESKITKLEQKKELLESELNNATLDRDELLEKSEQYKQLTDEIEEHTERWYELAERA